MIRERNFAEQTEHQPDGEFCNARCGSAWGVENGDSFLFRCLKVNIVEPDASPSDNLQFRIANQAGIDFCSASDYQRIILVDDAGKFCLVYSGLIVHYETYV